jgi:hypothetical protein
LKPSRHVPNHAGDLSRATGHLRAAVAKRRGRPPAASFLLQGVATSETNGAVKASYLPRETTQAIPEAQKAARRGKPLHVNKQHFRPLGW